MSRDMKPRKSTPSATRSKSSGNTLVGLFIGLVIGVVGAAGVVWYIYKTPPPFSKKTQPAPPSAPIQQGPVTPTPNQAPAPTPMALPGKPGDPIPQNGDKPRFDFYKILPGNAEAIPEPKPIETKAKNEKEAPVSEAVFLQTGSFQNASDADNQKAKLAMMGVEASVQQVMLQDKVWFRVRLGPFKKPADVANIRSELAKQGIEANIVK